MIPFVPYDELLAKLKLGMVAKGERRKGVLRFTLVDSRHNRLARIKRADWFRLLDAPVNLKLERRVLGEMTTTLTYNYAHTEDAQ